MKKTITIILAIAMFSVVIAGCAADTAEHVSEETDAKGGYTYESEYSDYNILAPNKAPIPDDEFYREGEGGYYGEEGRKAIKTADVQIEVNNFQNAYDTIKSMLGTNGYVEESNIWKTPSFYNGEQIMLTNGTIRLRIKADSFIGFTEGLSGIGMVLSSRSYEDDISDEYYDTEARLRLLKDEKARLEQYVEKVEDPEIFFQTQSRITQVIYEMEIMQGNIYKWDAKVEYSTVNITINEKHPDEESAILKPKGFFEKIWDNMKGTVNFLGEVVIFFAGLLPVLIVLGMIGIAVAMIIKKTSQRNKAPVKKDQDNKE